MRFYSQVICPRCMDWAMSDPILKRYRQETLLEVSGEILEIGFGTGLNLPYYPGNISKITTIDPNTGMNRQAKKRIAESTINVDCREIGTEKLPFDDNSFDSVVSTWTMCSIARIEQAIQQIYRVLKLKGKFFLSNTD